MPAVCRKLVRDRIPEIIQSEGRRPVTRVLDEASYRQTLLAKLIEEAREAGRATADDLPGDLADVLEVVRALTLTAGISWPQLLALAEDKRSQRGGFERRIFLESVERCSCSGIWHSLVTVTNRCRCCPDLDQRPREPRFGPALGMMAPANRALPRLTDRPWIVPRGCTDSALRRAGG
jgi:predicted house-cleaning noncanonical NTP pyrophosphatase (MazG superfamily)